LSLSIMTLRYALYVIHSTMELTRNMAQ
jgi:hypothetical protein